MKKLLIIAIFLTLFLSFCSFFSQEFTKNNCLAIKKDAIFTEVELEEYQRFEHEIPASILADIENELPSSKSDTTPSRNYTVVIDPGHGMPDPGSIGYKTKILESDLNLKLSFMLKEKLENAGINAIMTRTTENGLAEGRGKAFKKRDMELRKEIIKNSRPNMVISLHQNSYTNHSLHGAQVFYDKTSEISKQIANFIQEEFTKSLTQSNKFTSPGDYYMLKCTTAPSVIVECGFLSNAEEEQLLQTPEYQEKIVNAIYLGIVNFLQIK